MPSETASPIVIGLVQINNSFSNQQYLPYSTACLRAYVDKFSSNPDRYHFLPDIYKRQPISLIVENLRSADIVGFSTYVWNIEISKETARRLKKEDPHKVIVFGGPQVPDNAEKFLRENSFVDFVIHNEGEATFLEFLEYFPGRGRLGETQGISFIGVDDLFHKTPARPRIRDFTEVPSPFLSGKFDSLIIDNPNEKWIGLWETNRGCPFQCTFCDWGSATAAKVSKFELDRLYQELEWFANHKIEYIFVCDANFGIQKRDVEIARYVCEMKRRTGFPDGFSVQNTKNATERAYLTQKLLSDAGLNKGVALSMQSLDPVALKNIKRDNISLDTYLELSRRFTQDRVETYSDLILGLPGETYQTYLDGIDRLISAGQHNRIQFNNLSILPNAEMGSSEYLEKYQIKTVRSEIINIHGSRESSDDDVSEMQDLVVSNCTMDREQWRKARVVSWLAALLYFDKLAQIPLMVANHIAGINFKDIFERIARLDDQRYPILSEINQFFFQEALNIQKGGPEYHFSEEWLAIYWPADEFIFIKLTKENKLDKFYSEIEGVLINLIGGQLSSREESLIQEAVRLNRSLLSQPFVPSNTFFESEFNIYTWWRSALVGSLTADLPIMEKPVEIQRSKQYFADLEEWCRHIVWWGNKKGAYLYAVESESDRESSVELAGHY